MLIQQWHGTAQELARLCRAVEQHCSCAGAGHAAGPPCSAHALFSRQATLDHLLFVYRTRSHFLAREHQPD